MSEQTVAEMFELAYSNMSAIIPAERSKDEDRTVWMDSFKKGLRQGTQHILHTRDGVLRGFLSYTVRQESNDLYLNELQISPSGQGHGLVLLQLGCERHKALRPPRP